MAIVCLIASSLNAQRSSLMDTRTPLGNGREYEHSRMRHHLLGEWERLILAQLRLPRVVPCKNELEAGLSRKPRDPSQAKTKEGIGLPPHSHLVFALDVWHFHALERGPSQVCRSLDESGGMQRFCQAVPLFTAALYEVCTPYSVCLRTDRLKPECPNMSG